MIRPTVVVAGQRGLSKFWHQVGAFSKCSRTKSSVLYISLGFSAAAAQRSVSAPRLPRPWAQSEEDRMSSPKTTTPNGAMRKAKGTQPATRQRTGESSAREQLLEGLREMAEFATYD
jgi:hypothetical protein